MNENTVLTDDRSLKEAQDHLRKNLAKGAKCPCCARFAKLYKRQITSSMAYGLILLYINRHAVQNEMEYIHIENFFKNQNIASSIRADVPKLRFWNLIEPDVRGREEDENPANGLYRITEIGKQFVEGKASVNSHINVYNNRMYGHPKEGKLITITQALKEKFDYNKLMGKEVINEHI